jgi:hypothetical protein
LNGSQRRQTHDTLDADDKVMARKAAHSAGKVADAHRPELHKVRDGAEPVERLLVEAHVGLLLEEDRVLADEKEVAALEPAQPLPPHEARLERHLQTHDVHR